METKRLPNLTTAQAINHDNPDAGMVIIDTVEAYKRRQRGDKYFLCPQCGHETKLYFNVPTPYFAHKPEIPKDCKFSSGVQTKWHSDNKKVFPRDTHEVGISYGVKRGENLRPDVLTRIGSGLEFQREKKKAKVLKSEKSYALAGIPLSWMFYFKNRVSAVHTVQIDKTNEHEIAQVNPYFDYERAFKSSSFLGLRIMQNHEIFWFPHGMVFIDMDGYYLRLNPDKPSWEGYTDGSYHIPDFRTNFYLAQFVSEAEYYNYYNPGWQVAFEDGEEWGILTKEKVEKGKMVHAQRSKKTNYTIAGGKMKYSTQHYPHVDDPNCQYNFQYSTTKNDLEEERIKADQETSKSGRHGYIPAHQISISFPELDIMPPDHVRARMEAQIDQGKAIISTTAKHKTPAEDLEIREKGYEASRISFRVAFIERLEQEDITEGSKQRFLARLDDLFRVYPISPWEANKKVIIEFNTALAQAQGYAAGAKSVRELLGEAHSPLQELLDLQVPDLVEDSDSARNKAFEQARADRWSEVEEYQVAKRRQEELLRQQEREARENKIADNLSQAELFLQAEPLFRANKEQLIHQLYLRLINSNNFEREFIHWKRELQVEAKSLRAQGKQEEARQKRIQEILHKAEKVIQTEEYYRQNRQQFLGDLQRRIKLPSNPDIDTAFANWQESLKGKLSYELERTRQLVENEEQQRQERQRIIAENRKTAEEYLLQSPYLSERAIDFLKRFDEKVTQPENINQLIQEWFSNCRQIEAEEEKKHLLAQAEQERKAREVARKREAVEEEIQLRKDVETYLTRAKEDIATLNIDLESKRDLFATIQQMMTTTENPLSRYWEWKKTAFAERAGKKSS